MPMEKQESSMAKRKRRSMEVPPGKDVVGTKASSELELKDLPEEILPLIASLRDAVRTSILSRVWRQAWTYHPKLTFNVASMLNIVPLTSTIPEYSPRASRKAQSTRADKFIRNVNTVLQQHSGMGVTELAVRFFLYRKHADHLERWISFALASKVKVLVLVLDKAFDDWCERRYRFPCSLVNEQNSSCIRGLHLGSLSLKPPPNFRGFLNLKVVVLEEANYLKNLQYLLSGCHVLVRLTIILVS